MRYDYNCDDYDYDPEPRPQPCPECKLADIPYNDCCPICKHDPVEEYEIRQRARRAIANEY